MTELVTTACNVASLAVLIAAAAAAVVQLRHIRTGNQLQAVLAIERRFAQAEVQQAFSFCGNGLAERLAEPRYRAELSARGYIDPQQHPEMIALNWLNDAGTLVAGGFVDEAIFLESFGRLVEAHWTLLTPVVALLRRERGRDEYALVEYLAYRAMQWRAARRATVGASRVAPSDPWLDIDARLAAARAPEVP